MYKADQNLMNRFDYLTYTTLVVDSFTIRFRRTPQAFRCECLNTDGKVVASAYAIYPRDRKAELHRVYTVPEYRGKGLATLVVQALCDTIGTELDFYLTPSPNRIEGLTKDNMEEYRAKLIRFYESFGFVRVSDTKFTMIRKAALVGWYSL